ncbi:DNA methyltransferase [Microcoleus sp. herbarium8]|uniref:DNA methyltransferase n=1 Tax=Microcoleus sp. herbarium8 TaxID=3055436 RepID=UPI002FD3714A
MALSNIFSATPINRKEISQELLDIENKQRTNPLPWKGQFSPQFVEILINKYANQNSVIFDPFLGSGTVLYEAGRFGIEAYGTEINPAALILANIYKFINLLPTQREKYINCFLNRLHTEIFETMPLFQTIQKDVTQDDLIEKVVKLAVAAEQEFLNILHEALVILLDLDKKKVTYSKIFTIAENIAAFVIKLPYSEKPINAYNADARNIPLKNSSVNLVIASPPYINVFNYHQQYRASTEALNWKLLEVAKSEFGSNRKHRSNRFLTVIQYCLDIASTLQELLRICSHESRIIFVVGRESNIKGTPFFNGELVAGVASQVLGISLDIRQERSFVNRYGKTIKEDILHFVKLENQPYYFALHQARTLAVEALESAYSLADEQVKPEIKDAIDRVEKVQPSPYFDRHNSRKPIETLHPKAELYV